MMTLLEPYSYEDFKLRQIIVSSLKNRTGKPISAPSFDMGASRRISKNTHFPLPWNQRDYQPLLTHLRKRTSLFGQYPGPGGTSSLSITSRVALGSPTNPILLLTQIPILLLGILSLLLFHLLGYRSTYPKILLSPRSKILPHQPYHPKWQKKSRSNIRVLASIPISRLLQRNQIRIGVLAYQAYFHPLVEEEDLSKNGSQNTIILRIPSQYRIHQMKVRTEPHQRTGRILEVSMAVKSRPDIVKRVH